MKFLLIWTEESHSTTLHLRFMGCDSLCVCCLALLDYVTMETKQKWMPVVLWQTASILWMLLWYHLALCTYIKFSLLHQFHKQPGVITLIIKCILEHWHPKSWHGAILPVSCLGLSNIDENCSTRAQNQFVCSLIHADEKQLVFNSGVNWSTHTHTHVHFSVLILVLKYIWLYSYSWKSTRLKLQSWSTRSHTHVHFSELVKKYLNTSMLSKPHLLGKTHKAKYESDWWIFNDRCWMANKHQGKCKIYIASCI